MVLMCGIWLFATDGGVLLDRLGEIHPLVVVVLLLLAATILCIRFFRWQFLLRRAGVRIPIRRSLMIYLASLAGMATPFMSGELIRCWLLKKRFDAPLTQTIGVLALERVYDALALFLIVWVFLPKTSLGSVAWSIAATLLILLALLMLLRPVLTGPLRPFRDCVSSLVVMQSFAATLAAWVLTGIMAALAASAVGLSLPLSAGLGVFSQAILAGSATLVPAGTGTTSELLQSGFVVHGVPVSTALLAVAVLRFTHMGLWWALGGGILFLELARTQDVAPSNAAEHFDAISGEYATQFSEHVWNHLLARKISMVESAAVEAGTREKMLGLDLGCGLGLQYSEMARRGFQLVGVDASHELLRLARRGGATVATASAMQLPFPDQSLDFVYTVGVLHHLPGPEAQTAACQEVARILKPGGRFIVHESNPRNPLFRFYMGYVFPLLKTIDEGTEWWIETDRWKMLPGMELSSLRYFTFLPDFIPNALMGPFVKVERWLERSRYNPHSVHYMAVLTRR